MTHPTPPKRYEMAQKNDHGIFVPTMIELDIGDYMLTDEALAYAEARAKQARLDALEEAALIVQAQHDFRKTTPDSSKALDDDVGLLKETMDEIRKLKVSSSTTVDEKPTRCAEQNDVEGV